MGVFKGMSRTELQTELNFLNEDLVSLVTRAEQVQDEINAITLLLTPKTRRAKTARKTARTTRNNRNR
jgi:hypothetical protein